MVYNHNWDVLFGGEGGDGGGQVNSVIGILAFILLRCTLTL